MRVPESDEPKLGVCEFVAACEPLWVADWEGVEVDEEVWEADDACVED